MGRPKGSPNRAIPLTAEQRSLVERCHAAQASYLAGPLDADAIAGRRKAAADAMAAGAPAREVGEAMGISRQGAHRLARLGGFRAADRVGRV